MNPLVPDFILHQESEKRTKGTFVAAGLFVDIPGFTGLTEKLVQHGREGAEILAGTLRFYFDPLVALVHEAGGFITSFAGDAFSTGFEIRYQRGSGDLDSDFAAPKIDLGGWTYNFTAGYRF